LIFSEPKGCCHVGCSRITDHDARAGWNAGDGIAFPHAPLPGLVDRCDEGNHVGVAGKPLARESAVQE
jgi:hypothetical protein